MTTEKILLNYEPIVSNLLPALKEASAVFGYVSRKDAQKIADYFSVSLSKVFETASFYDLVNVERQPNMVVKVCSGTHCAVKDSLKLIAEIENRLHIKAGDGNNPKIKLEIISCIGRCGEGPIVIVNDKVYEKVTVNMVGGILEEYL